MFSEPFHTPILIIVFNRLDCVKNLLASLKMVKPTSIYIASDGYRNHVRGEQESVLEIRDFIVRSIDWDCKINTKFNDSNKGCKLGVSEAIDWFFENENRGIILEDDCIPNLSFYKFCEKMLVEYQNNDDILHIGGTNPFGISDLQSDYYFSNFNRIWGWATWRRAWLHFDVDIKQWPSVKQNGLLSEFFNAKTAKHYSKILDQVYNGKIDTWDYQWFLCRLLNGKAIIPKQNLISNIGFSASATHTFDGDSPYSNMKTFEINFPLKHPLNTDINIALDEKWERIVVGESKLKKLYRTIIKLIR